MKVKVTGVVKYSGVWRQPGDVLEDVKPEIAQQMVEQDVGEIIETAEKPNDDKLQALRERAKELGIPRASQMGETKLLEAIAAKEAELAEKSGAEENEDSGAVEVSPAEEEATDEAPSEE